MKRILLACCFLALTGTIATAQSAKQNAPAQSEAAATDPKLLFSSKINELDAFLTRGNQAQAQTAAQDLMIMMSNRMAQNKDQQSATAKQQSKLYGEAKQMSADINANHKKLVETLHSFLQTY